MSDEKYNSFDKEFERIKQEMLPFGLKPLRSTYHPRDHVFAYECLYCQAWWGVKDKPFHWITCKNPHVTDAPKCPMCHYNNNVIKHKDGEWVCHGTHKL